MLPKHVLNRGMKVMELQTNPSDSPKIDLITEEILYYRILSNHKLLMLFVLIFHLSIITVTLLNTFLNGGVVEQKYLCQHAYDIKNISYIILNFILVIFALQSLKRSKAMIANIQFYEKTGILLVLGMLSSTLILLFKFIPDFICVNCTLSFFNCFIMSAHLFCENMVLLVYIKWFKNELRNFGALVN